MKTNVTLTLDTRYIRKDGTASLIFRLSHQGRTLPLPTGSTKYSISPKDWNQKTRRIKKTYMGVTSVIRLNNKLDKKKTKYIDTINKLDEKGELITMDINALKKMLIAKTGKGVSFFEFADKAIKQLQKSEKLGTAKKRQDATKAFENYLGSRLLSFEEITPQFLKKYEAHFLGKGNSKNGLATYLWSIRKLYNDAIEEGLVHQDFYPFKKYQIKTESTKKRAISKEKMQRIMYLDLQESHSLFNARNYFIASYLMQGMSFIDMAFLTVDDTISGRISYRRKKTSRLYNMKITEQLAYILNYYLKGKQKGDFVFPILKRDSLRDQYRDVVNKRAAYNAGLKEIAKLCDIEEHITSYVSRHSLATNLMKENVPVTAIQKMLGHEKLQTTVIYLKELSVDEMDEYQDLLEL